ncbi:HAD family hydrolase [Desulforhopalus singaporensis]|uniref:Soluble P-type ATPase n=1 Tax=Desulforhopalus singaporensis TaxID=91360 RepID=A0A1H0LZH3_9BACT|nr:HAD family hydrolase [Desulforhopalus singaporensis]SDO73622.1 Soluble P-type ATPase [Desulforhopalus singaporensis]
MIQITVPGVGVIRLAHLVLDYNGTMAEDGLLLDGVEEKLAILAERLQVHVVTADTHGTVAAALANNDVTLHIIGEKDQERQKQHYVQELGQQTVMAVGNGSNDRLMLETAELGVALVQREGACCSSVFSADIVCTDILDVFDLVIKPDRLRATLRK